MPAKVIRINILISDYLFDYIISTYGANILAHKRSSNGTVFILPDTVTDEQIDNALLDIKTKIVTRHVMANYPLDEVIT